MESFGQRIRHLRENTGLSRESMAALLGLSESAVYSYETNYSQPSVKTLSRIAQIFGVSEAYVALLTEDPSVAEDPSVKEIYVADCVRAGSGMIMKNDIVGTVFMSREDTHGKEHYALVMPDNSLIKARVEKGDILIVRRQNHASDGDMVVALVGDNPAIVRRYSRKGNIVTLTPETSSPEYKAIKVDTTETPFLISGKVVEVRMKNI